ncbi:hypothetical protein M405DRAFT_236758 [Rhizopogon salebrosus TDB-379]|nr:hypothetical protein M405DRAFT_236758 [Rhizopogon salebrosus TDB-379]
MKNSAFFSFPHHLSYKPRYSSPSPPLRISVVGGIWIPSSRFYLPFLCHPPFFTLGFRSSFTRNVRHTIKPFFTLNPHIPSSFTEVDRIFDHPLEAMLDPHLLLNSWELLVGE